MADVDGRAMLTWHVLTFVTGYPGRIGDANGSSGAGRHVTVSRGGGGGMRSAQGAGRNSRGGGRPYRVRSHPPWSRTEPLSLCVRQYDRYR